ncbi:hypothetical protein GGR58DRAFT_462786 [Xylaria digitata]|nr:hypothetical protein GGR58DRAFT_462786 [Xylaria digitata]
MRIPFLTRIPFLRAARKPQTIPASSIDPTKPAQKLRSIGPESVEVHMINDTYHIWAARHLSTSEIEECRI